MDGREMDVVPGLRKLCEKTTALSDCRVTVKKTNESVAPDTGEKPLMPIVSGDVGFRPWRSL